MTDALLLLAGQKQTYRNLLYLFLALPLGIFYFVMVILGLSFSLVSIILICIPLAILFIYLWWKLAAFERWMAMHWLMVDVPPMAQPFKPDTPWFRRVQLHLLRAVTWKSMVFLFLKFPGGLLSFYILLMALLLIVMLGIVGCVAGIVIAPFMFLGAAIRQRDLDGKKIRRYLLLSFTGFGLVLLPLYVVNALAMLWGELARVMLGMSDTARRLMQATELAEQERARAMRAEKSRSDLIINVSHELRTPVASIRGHIESLMLACDESESRVPPAQTLHDYLGIVHRESIRLGTLFDDLLSVARAEASELRVNLTAVEAGAVVEEVYQILMPLARRERQITLIREITSGLPLIRADRQRLTQVLLNLVRNAITYTPDGGIVSISLQAVSARQIALLVSDTGIGIPREDHEQIFERFYRTDVSRARNSGGFGLGLSIVRDFVIAMGGSISVESSMGVGSCFRVLLNVA